MRRALLLMCAIGCGSDPDSGSETLATTQPTTTVGTTCPDGSNCAETTDASTASSSGAATSSSSTGTSDAGTSSSTSDGTDSMGTFNPVTESGVMEESADSTAPADCSMTPDCASCWDCAHAGPCNAGYASCEAQFNCIPSLICSEQCANDGLQQDCVTTCCMSCTDLMTCPMVDAVITCIEAECATQCGMVDCPG